MDQPSILLDRFFPADNPPLPGFNVEPGPPWKPSPRQDYMIISRRNQAIYAIFLQFFCCIIGFSLNSVRRSLSQNLLNILIFISAFFGARGIIWCKTWYVYLHGCLVFPLLIIVIIASFVEAFVLEPENGWVIILLYIPFYPNLVFAVFIWRFFLILKRRNMVATGERKPDPADYYMAPGTTFDSNTFGEVLSNQIDRSDIKTKMRMAAEARMKANTSSPPLDHNMLCVSCLTKVKDSTLQPCQHTELCTVCAKEYLEDGRPCPKCLENFSSYT